jgi:hypothetical protein
MLLWWVNLAGRILDPIVIFFCILVLWHYAPAAWRHGKPKSAHEWLVLGIVLGFMGKVLDVGYWTWFWAGHLMSRPWVKDYVDIGPLSVLVLRQVPSMLAAFCHVMGCWRFLRDRDCPVDVVVPVSTSLLVAFVLSSLVWILVLFL